jgi:glycosyltransferase involved in cell wall biosynthesis
LLIHKNEKIGIDASRAFLPQRTGIEEYSLQVIKALARQLKGERVVLFVARRIWLQGGDKRIDQIKKEDPRELARFFQTEYNFEIPFSWEVRLIPFYFFWTQLGLSLELLLQPVERLLVPAHTVPLIHPARTVVVVHGLEYEHCPESYSLCSRIFHRIFIKRSCRWSEKIVTISKKTRDDLRRLYGVPKEKIKVIYNGFTPSVDFKKGSESKLGLEVKAQKNKKDHKKSNSKLSQLKGNSFLLFISRLDQRKNLQGVIRIFEELKRNYSYLGKLVLAGKEGFGFKSIKKQIEKNEFSQDIVRLGYVTDQEREWLFAKADIFLFPSLFEGFGLPVLEAQERGLPVITSRRRPLSEVAGNEKILIDPQDYPKAAELANRILTQKDFRKKIIEEGYKNTQKFSWDKCAKKIAKLLVD